jgi:hypothetical protein
MSASFFALRSVNRDTDETPEWHSGDRKKENSMRRIATIAALALTTLALMAAPAMASVVNIHL